jgi:hypothetical protein
VQTMLTVREPVVAGGRPKSQSPHAAWKTEVPVPPEDGPQVLQRVAHAADVLLSRAGKGGTECPLRLILGIADVSTAAALCLASSAPLLAGPSGSITPFSSAPADATTGVPGRLTLLFVFDGDGRLKASVKRSFAKLFTSLTAASSISSPTLDALEAWTLASVLRLVLQTPRHTMVARWFGLPNSVVPYLENRVASTYGTSASDRVSSSAALACSGVDSLGPTNRTNRKRPLTLTLVPRNEGSSSEGSSGPLAIQPEQSTQLSSSTFQDQIHALFTWNGEVIPTLT